MMRVALRDKPASVGATPNMMHLVARLYKRQQTRNSAFFVALVGLHFGQRSAALSDGN
jgi:hypothetical protein